MIYAFALFLFGVAGSSQPTVPNSRAETVVNKPNLPIVPRVSPSLFVRFGDYPPIALVERASAKVPFELTVTPDGRVGSCKVLAQEAHQVLREKTCWALTRRAIFWPATNQTGVAISGTYSSNVTWEIDLDQDEFYRLLDEMEVRANSGEVPAMTGTARRYEMAVGVQRDLRAAEMWYSRAAASGDHYAMYHLAMLYETYGQSSRKSVEIRELVTRSASAGNEKAATWLQQIEKEERHAAWLKSPEGIAFTRKREAELAAAKREAERKYQACLLKNGYNKTRNSAAKAVIERNCR